FPVRLAVDHSRHSSNNQQRLRLPARRLAQEENAPSQTRVCGNITPTVTKHSCSDFALWPKPPREDIFSRLRQKLGPTPEVTTDESGLKPHHPYVPLALRCRDSTTSSSPRLLEPLFRAF